MVDAEGPQYVLTAGTVEPRREDFARVLLDVADSNQVAQIDPEDCRRIANWLAPVDASEFEEIRAAREDQLRQLLSWARDLSTDPLHSMTETSSLSEEFANRLAVILDGES